MIVVAMTGAMISAVPAQAFGSETFGCRISPGTVFTWNTTCNNNTEPANTYNVGFMVQNTSGSGYSYTWSISGPYTSVYSGCTSTSADCAVLVSGRAGDEEIDATVTVTQAGQSEVFTSHAFINAWCWTGAAYELC